VTSGQPTQVTLFLTDKSLEAAIEASNETGDNLTDTINRALVVYNQVLRASRTGGSFSFQVKPDRPDEVRVQAELVIAPRT